MDDRVFEQIPEQALDWHRAGRGAILATVIETWGSAPRRTGAQLAIAGDGAMQGSVSGGCVEGAVVLEAQEALEQGAPRLLEYGVSDDDAFAVGLTCGGTIRIAVEPVGAVMPEQVLSDLVAARAKRRRMAYILDLKTFKGHLASDGYETLFARDFSGIEEDGRHFVAIHNPPLRLVVIGAVHIAQALIPMAHIAGYDPVIIDPRTAFGNAARFPRTRILDAWPDAALSDIGIDARTGIVLLSHDPKLDDPALHAALRSEAFYIGALGSPKTHAKRVARLQKAGFAAAQIARISAPVGLDIGAAGPAEIAVSILAEMTQRLRMGV